MKPSPQALPGLLKRLDPATILVLCFGPDEALARERAAQFGAQTGVARDDPFARVDLSADAVAADPARLADEACALGLMTPRKLITVSDASDALVGGVEALLANPHAANLVVMTAGDLGKRSALRLAVEAAPRALAVACYADDDRGMRSLIETEARALGLGLDRAAVDQLLRVTGNARDIARAELEKLSLYVGRGPVSVDAIEAVCADDGDSAIDRLVNAVADLKPAEAARQLRQLFAEGEAAIALLRALARRFWQLREARGAIDDGQPPEAAIKALRPPVFWKDVRPVTAQAQRWSLAACDHALAQLLEIERAIKQSGSVGDLLAEQGLLALATPRSAR